MDNSDLSQVPAATPPAGVMPNFIDPPSQQAPMIAVSTVVLAITVVFVTIRIYTGVRILRRLGTEEVLTLIANLFSAVYIGIVLSLSHESRHLWDVPLVWFTENYWKCKTLLNWAVIQGSLDIALDLYIFILPLPTVLSLQMPKRKKIGVLLVFLTGFLAVIANGIGFYFRYELTFTPDINWNEGAYICAAIVEINIAIICSCMPACATLYRHERDKSSLFTPIRRFLDHYILKSSTSDTQETPKLYTGDHSTTKHGAPPSPPPHNYIYLQDASSFGPKSVAYHSDNTSSTPSHPTNNSIRKTIDVVVV